LDYIPYYEITDKIIHAFYKVYNTLGYGFLEKVYENAMVIVLIMMGCKVLKQNIIKVYYENVEIGEYFTDLLVEDLVIVELKALDFLSKKHKAQLINYLKATQIEVGVILNFGQKAQFKRKIFSNDNKNQR